MTNKEIFRYALSFMGGTARVFEYRNSNDSQSVDIMTCQDSLYKKVDVNATIGLSNTPINMVWENKPVGVELIDFGGKNETVMAHILADVAFQIMRDHHCQYGEIFTDVFKPYQQNMAVRHVILLSPVYWPDYKMLVGPDRVISWLLLMPITEAERIYIESHGLNAFEALLEKEKGDLTDPRRASIV